MLPSQAKKHVFLNEYSSHALRSSTYDIMQSFEQKNIALDHSLALDAHMMNYKHWPSLVFNPNTRSSWENVLRGYYDSDEYKRMNEKVHSNPLLAKMATMNFLESVVKSVNKNKQNQGGNQPSGQQGGQNIQSYFNQLNRMPQQQSQQIVQSIVAGAASQASNTDDMADAMAGFSHMGIPLERYDLDQVREILSNKIAINMMKIFRKMVSLPMGKNLTAPSPRRGIPIGTKVMRSFSEIVDMLPGEYLDDDLMTLKVATRTAQVRQRYSGIKNVVVYLDKSGSMGGSMPYEGDYVQRVAFAGGCAFALAKQHHIDKFFS